MGKQYLAIVEIKKMLLVSVRCSLKKEQQISCKEEEERSRMLELVVPDCHISRFCVPTVSFTNLAYEPLTHKKIPKEKIKASTEFKFLRCHDIMNAGNKECC